MERTRGRLAASKPDFCNCSDARQLRCSQLLLEGLLQPNEAYGTVVGCSTRDELAYLHRLNAPFLIPFQDNCRTIWGDITDLDTWNHCKLINPLLDY